MLKRINFLWVLSWVLLSFAAQALAQSQIAERKLSLQEIRMEQFLLVQKLRDQRIPKLNKQEMILQNKQRVETSLRELIVDGDADPADISRPHTEMAQAFQGVDLLIALSQLKVDQTQKNFTEESCVQAKSLLLLQNLQADSDSEVSLSQAQQKALNLIDQLCQPHQ